MIRRLAVVCSALLLAVNACSGAGPVATVDGVELTRADLDAIHPDVEALSADELAGSVLLLILHEALTVRASSEFGLTPDPATVDEVFAGRAARFEARGALEEVLALSNETPQRIRIEALLDVVRDDVSAHLVRTEAPGFDIDRAYEDYLLGDGEVCIRHIQVAEIADHDTAVARLAAGEDFADVARDLSVDPFVSREDGGTGAGGDLGCSTPGALPPGLGTGVLDLPLGEVSGPIVSSVGVHLVVVYARDLPELADVRDEVVEAAIATQGPEMFRLWAVGILQELDVTLDGAIGVWGVLPETDPVPTVVPPSRVRFIIDG